MVEDRSLLQCYVASFGALHLTFRMFDMLPPSRPGSSRRRSFG